MASGPLGQPLAWAASELWGMGDLGEFRGGVLSVMRGLIPADMGSYNEIAADPPDALVIADPHDSLGEVTDDRKRRFAELVWQNPLAAHSARTGDPTARRMSEFITRRQLHSLELYDAFYSEMGVEHQMAFTVPAAGRLIGVTLSRGTRDFTDRERDLLEEVRKLAAPLYRSLLDRARLGAVLAALDGIDAHGRGPLAVLLVHGSGALEAAHARAERLLRALAAERASLRQLHAWAHLQRGGRGAGAGEATLRLRAGELRAVYLHGRPGALDAICLYARSRSPVEVLSGLGLTARQARVLELMCEGASNAEIAHALTLSRHTVRHHAEEIYRRLGVRSRAGATSRAARALRADGDGELL